MGPSAHLAATTTKPWVLPATEIDIVKVEHMSAARADQSRDGSRVG